MKISYPELGDCAKDFFLRMDQKYHAFLRSGGDNVFSTPEEGNVLLSDIVYEDYIDFEYVDGKDFKGVPTGQRYVDEDGEIVNVEVVNKDDHPDRLKYAASPDHILLSSLRMAKAPALQFDKLPFDEYVFSNGFYSLKVKPGWEKRFVLHLLRNEKIRRIIDESIYRGLGISTYRCMDLLKCRVRGLTIAEQRKALRKVKPFEEKISQLKKSIKDIQILIDDILVEEFSLPVEQLLAVDRRRRRVFEFGELGGNNVGCRFSFRYRKAMDIQELLSRQVVDCVRLGPYITGVRNGWSPDCSGENGELRVLGIDAINKSTRLSFSNIKISSNTSRRSQDCIIRDGDFFVSRGNTVDLVSLASIAEVGPEDPPTIFPDLFIRVEFSSLIDKRYLAYVFNSLIGRLYFKNAAKGKNQTMVKVSPRELSDFVIPLPSANRQREIAKKIDAAINAQTAVRAELVETRHEIDSVIEKTFRG